MSLLKHGKDTSSQHSLIYTHIQRKRCITILVVCSYDTVNKHATHHFVLGPADVCNIKTATRLSAFFCHFVIVGCCFMINHKALFFKHMVDYMQLDGII